jgi:hypothetical protein
MLHPDRRTDKYETFLQLFLERAELREIKVIIALSCYVWIFNFIGTLNGRWNCSVLEGVAPLVLSICTACSPSRPQSYTPDVRTHSSVEYGAQWPRKPVRNILEEKTSWLKRELNHGPSYFQSRHYTYRAIVAPLRRLHVHSIMCNWQDWTDTASTKQTRPFHFPVCTAALTTLVLLP